ncbi:DUF1837 domain-containing protein [Adhaeribacter swui]|uniref:DUF1837 domain-containing protein n=1 Tax=Adhaeribacter swui TaxID=2086471 RepID=A0A7G7G9U6_9BACT|nr:DUF1837 domain-containing protein [Adhaeribacter swui]QNF33930.1 DUF1837 domain-containing protein [Adhaeribacter swui]
MPRPFKSDLVINEQINDATLKAYHVGFDQNKFRLQPLVDVIRNVIPEFSLGFHCGNIPQNEIITRLKEAAETVYLTDKYKSRGEFGELILHLLLRDFHNTIPLLSKIWFKDTYNVPVHGFDGIHITIENNVKKLWLGESKLFKTGKDGIKDLAKDIVNHVNGDYLRKEFNLISRKIPADIPEREHWIQLMDRHQKLDIVFSSIVIPMVCTYSSDLFKKHDCEDQLYLNAFINECNSLHGEFTKLNTATNVEIILMLLPVPDKNELNTELDKRLKAMQSI